MTDNTEPYLGPDRRQRAAYAPLALSRRSWAAISIAIFVYGLLLPTVLSFSFGGARSEAERAIGSIVSAILFGQAGLLFLLRWRLTGEAQFAWMGTSSFLYGVAGISLSELMALVNPAVDPWIVGSVAVGLTSVVSAGLALRAAGGSEVDSRIRPGRLIGIWAAVLAGISLVLALSPVLLAPSKPGAAVLVLGVAAAGAWLAAALRLRWAKREGDPIPKWASAGFGALALSQALGAAGIAKPVPFVLDQAAMATVAGLALFLVAGFALLVTFSDQGSAMMTLQSLMSGLQRERESDQHRIHDARGMLMAVRTALTTLIRFRELLDESEASELERAVEAELQQLVELVREPSASSELVSFDLGALVADMAATTEGDLQVEHAELDGQPNALGDPAKLARVVRNLLDNAQKYGGGSPIRLRIEATAGTVELQVIDGGPGVDPAEAELIFSRGGRGSAAKGVAGSGLGLFSATQLMADQGGSLTLRDNPEGGAIFVVRLAASKRSSAPSQQSSGPPAEAGGARWDEASPRPGAVAGPDSKEPPAARS